MLKADYQEIINEYINITIFEINYQIKLLTELLKTVSNPIHRKQMEINLKSYRACKELIDRNKK